MAPTPPAAGSPWPNLAFAAWSTSGNSLLGAEERHNEEEEWLLLLGNNTAEAAAASMGSPSGVPVPCISRTETSASDESGGADAPPPPPPPPPSSAPSSPQATKSAARSTLCCAGPEGAVRAAERPSWLTAEPASSASGAGEGEEAAAKAAEAAEAGDAEEAGESSSILSMTSSTHASALPYPSAEASSVLQRASAASMPALESTAGVSDRSERLTPPATPRREQEEEDGEEETPPLFAFPLPLPASSLRNDDTVRCSPTSDAEHAVSIATHAPLSPRANESRPAAAESVPEVADSADSCPASEAFR